MNENIVIENDLMTKKEVLSLTKNDFFVALDKLSNILKDDIEKLSKIEKEKSKEIIDGFNRQLDFLESYKAQEDIPLSLKEKIYDDFNKIANELGEYQITIYKSQNKEKTIKQIMSGLVDAAKILSVGAIVITLIKKSK